MTGTTTSSDRLYWTFGHDLCWPLIQHAKLQFVNKSLMRVSTHMHAHTRFIMTGKNLVLLRNIGSPSEREHEEIALTVYDSTF